MHGIRKDLRVFYRYAVLRSDKSSEAQAHNEQWLGTQTLGVEVTQKSLAARCGLGNIDPQHAGDRNSSAIEAAMDWDLPPNDTRLVTLREDRDAIGAMAVLRLRAEGKMANIDKYLVSLIGVLDRKPIEQASVEDAHLIDMCSRLEMDVLNYIVKSPSSELPLPRKVSLVASILVHEMSESDLARFNAKLSRQKESRRGASFDAEMYGNVAYVYALHEYDSARDWANRRYEVAVIFDPERKTASGGVQKRWCVIRQASPQKMFDRFGFEDAVNAAEAKARGLTLEQLKAQDLAWGGPSNIIVSAQGAGNDSHLSKHEILALARTYLESGVVT